MIAQEAEPKLAVSTRWRDAEEMRWAARHWAVKMGVRVPHIHIRPMTTKWASMSTSGRLTLDSGLLNVPRELGEFVMVHELAHMLAPNHGKVFKSFMYAYMPDWPEREIELKAFTRADEKQRGRNSRSIKAR